MEVYKFKCKNCGSREYVKTDETTYKCPYCGYKEEIIIDKKQKITEQDVYENKKDLAGEEVFKKQSGNIPTYIMLIICVFFGAFGIHKFIEKKIGLGLLYLFTIGFFYIGWLMDIYHYIKEIQKENKGK